MSETVGGEMRTSTATFDAAGRAVRSTINVTDPSLGRALPEVRMVYSAETGLQTDVQTLADNQPTATIEREYDELGRITAYVDETGNRSTTTYDIADRVVSRSDGKGSSTTLYDEGGERRGLPTSLVDSQAGTFTAVWDAERQLEAQVYPNGVGGTYDYDSVGNVAKLSYTAPSWGVTLADVVTPNAHGEWAARVVANSKQVFDFDKVGRLVQVASTPNVGGCTTRRYDYDANSNRTALTSWGSDPDGECVTIGSGDEETRTYDAADRLIDTGFGYDPLGRITGVPSADAGGAGLETEYFANDMVAAQTQAGRTLTWELDPARRLSSWEDSIDSSTHVNHYSCDCDGPSWIADGVAWSRYVPGFDGGLA
ncbi:MAG: RHS repeat-associated core domain-containing protein, partial [Gammaproteobacteria bacterium]